MAYKQTLVAFLFDRVQIVCTIGSSFCTNEFDDVAWLTIEVVTYALKGGESDGFDFTHLEVRHVDTGDANCIGKLGDSYASVFDYVVQAQQDGHCLT